MTFAEKLQRAARMVRLEAASRTHLERQHLLHLAELLEAEANVQRRKLAPVMGPVYALPAGPPE